MKLENKSVKQLKADAWKYTSLFVRQSNADWRGYGFCFTCFISKQWKELQAGHFIHNKLDFDLRNIKPQCVKCNQYLSGNLGVYAIQLIRKNGLAWVDKLRSDANEKGNLYTKEELIEIILDLKEKINALK